MEDFSGHKRYAEYSSFTVSDETNKYKMNIGSYSGTAGLCVKLSLCPVAVCFVGLN